MKRKIALLLATLLVTSAMGACTPSTTPAAPSADTTDTVDGDKLDLVVWARVNDAPKYEEALAPFIAEHPNYNISIVGVGSNYDDLIDKIITGVAANDYPNVSQLGQRSGLSQLYDSGKLLPVEDFMTEDEQNDILPAYWERYTYKGKRIIVPYQASMPVLYYNKTYLEANNIAIPTTFEELVAAAAKAAKDTNGDGAVDIYGFNWPDDGPWYMQSLANSMGGPQTYDADGKAYLNTPSYERLFGLISQMVHTDKSMASNQHATVREDFANENLIFFMSSCASRGGIEKMLTGSFEMGIAYMPMFSEKHVPIGGNGVGLFDHNEAENKAAWEIVQYLIQPESIAMGVADKGYIPISQTVLEHPSIASFMEDPYSRIVIEQLEYLTCQGVRPSDSVVWSGLEAIMEVVEADPNADIPGELKKLQEKTDKYIAEYAK